MRDAQSKKLTFRQHVRTIKAALFLFNHKHELKRLMIWAENKRRKTRAKHFIYVRQAYAKRDAIAQQKLILIHLHYPKHYWLAYCLHQISNLVSVNPAYHRRLASSRIK